MNGVPVARHGPILSQDGATASGMLFFIPPTRTLLGPFWHKSMKIVNSPPHTKQKR